MQTAVHDLTFGSLFDGIYGFGLGFEDAGMRCLWRSEIDPSCNALMAQRRPDVPNLGDVRYVGRHNEEPVDLICGGFPCQDLSVAGKRAGLAGKRSGLWFEYHRVLDELRPQWVVIENVPGLLSSDGGRDFAVVLRGLVELGYGVTWRILDAQYFGVPQRRRRVFIIGSLGNGRSAEVLFERKSGSGNTPPSREAGARVAPTIAGGFAGAGGGNRYGMNVETADSLIASTLNSGGNSGGFRTEPGEHLVVARSTGAGWYTQDDKASLRANPGGTTFDLIAFSSKDYGNDAAQDVSPTLRSMNFDGSHINGGGQVAVCFESRFARNGRGAPSEIVPPLKAESGQTGKGDGAPLVAFSENQRGEVVLSDIAHQLTSGGGKPGQGYPATMGSFGVRRLTPTECERLQGFPDGWTAGQSDSARYRQLGNAVCVAVSHWIGEQLMTQLEAQHADLNA
jgi:DNA (cytosine-5)-methyltransferase 1